MSSARSLVVPAEAAGQRLDHFLATELGSVSRSRVQLLLEQSQVLVNGAAAKPSLKRFSLMPELPTVAELGLPGFDATTWHGLVAPAGTPRPVIETLNRAMVQALADPDTVRQLHDLGVEVGSSTPEEFAAYIRSEIPKWAAVVKASGAQVE